MVLNQVHPSPVVKDVDVNVFKECHLHECFKAKMIESPEKEEIITGTRLLLDCAF